MCNYNRRVSDGSELNAITKSLQINFMGIIKEKKELRQHSQREGRVVYPLAPPQREAEGWGMQYAPPVT